MENKEKFMEWMKGAEYSLLPIQRKYDSYVFFKQKYNDRLDLIYAYDNVKDGIIRLDCNPEYQGIYDRESRIIYGIGYTIRNVIGEYEYDANSVYSQRCEFEEKVREGVEAEVRKFEDDIQVDEEYREKYKYYAEDSARTAYLNGVQPDYKYECEYEDENFLRKLIEYIMNPQEVVQKCIDEFLETHHDSIVDQIKGNKLTAEVVSEYMKNKDIHLYAMKKIIESVPTDCKTVNITMLKDEIELTFKYPADSLRRDCGTSYSSWNIPAQDRQKFEKMYGRHTDFKPEDITKITYCRKLIYERNGNNEKEN